jgi:hypothetical protein
MGNNVNPIKQSEQNEPVQPGLDPSATGKPRQSDPKTDPKPGQPKKKGDPGYRPER